MILGSLQTILGGSLQTILEGSLQTKDVIDGAGCIYFFLTNFANPGHSGVIDKGKCVDEELRKAHTSFCLLDLRVHSLKGIFSPPSPLLT